MGSNQINKGKHHLSSGIAKTCKYRELDDTDTLDSIYYLLLLIHFIQLSAGTFAAQFQVQ